MDDVVKHRLIGAAVLIALIAIFLPLLFKESQLTVNTIKTSTFQIPTPQEEATKVAVNTAASSTTQLAVVDPAKSAAEKTAAVDVTPDASPATPVTAAATTPAAEPVQPVALASDAATPTTSSSTDKVAEKSVAVDSTSTASVATKPATHESDSSNAIAAKPATSKPDFVAAQIAQIPEQKTEKKHIFVDKQGETDKRVKVAAHTKAEKKAHALHKIASAKKPVAIAHKATGKESWVVQVASFSTSKNAKDLEQRLRHAGFSAYSEASKDKHGMTRVFVGPAGKSRDSAEMIKLKLQHVAKVHGIVINTAA